jgi:protoheme IX farnesyltransferase
VAETAPGPWFRLTALAAAAATLLAVVSGAAALGTAHRLLAALAVPPLAALVAASWAAHRRLLIPWVSALVLFGVAALVTADGVHLALAGVAFGATVVAAALSARGRVALGSWRDHLTLTKPRVMTLLLATGFCGMVAGAHGLPPWQVAVAGMGGLALACAGASALNHVLDRDIDRLMGARTRARPVAADRMPAAHALEFGLALSALSFTLLASVVNVLAACLALAGGLFYVLIYTRWLKRATVQNIVIGGAAGAVPPLVGWAVATGELGWTALFLFLIVFLWTPPHFWALALLLKRDYEAARVPMLPVVRGEAETTRQILLYSLALVPVTLLPALTGLGWLYAASALALGAWFCVLAWRLRRETTPARAAGLFRYSMAYLALLFVALAIDSVVI